MSKNDSIEMLQNKISVLKKAKKYVRKGEGVCYSIFTAYKLGEESSAYASLDKCISRNLGDCVWLVDWVVQHRPGLSTSKANMKQYRLQWIDWMIGCLQEDLAWKDANGHKRKKANEQA